MTLQSQTSTHTAMKVASGKYPTYDQAVAQWRISHRKIFPIRTRILLVLSGLLGIGILMWCFHFTNSTPLVEIDATTLGRSVSLLFWVGFLMLLFPFAYLPWISGKLPKRPTIESHQKDLQRLAAQEAKKRRDLAAKRQQASQT